MKRVLAVLAASVALAPLTMAQAQMFDQYGGYTGLKGSNTSGFFRVEKINGRYWLLTPENNVFWSTGICVLQYYDTWGGYCPVLNYYPNPYGNKAKYPGGISEWASAMHDRMDRWGFNTNACWGVANIQNKVECICDLSLTVRASAAGCRMVTSDFPDLWDPIWETTCDTQCKNRLSSNKDNPWTIGAFPYNELHWTNPSGFKSIPDAYIAEPADAPGKQHWVNDFLKARYATIADLNTAYGTSYTDWTELLSINQLPDDANHPARLNDKIDFMEDIADRFYSTATFYMRKYDPNHLVFTTRWAMWWQGYADPYTRPFNERIWKKAGEYCDVFANNGYVDFAAAEANYQHSSRVFEQSRKPFIVTEHSSLANDSYFAYSPWWLPTQMDRGSWYFDQVKKLLDIGVADDPNDPGNPAKTCMGIHWFQCYDEPSLGRPDGEKAQFGVFNAQDEAFLPFVEMAKTVNSQIYDYSVNGTPFDIPEPPTAVSPIGKGLQQSERASSFERVHHAFQMNHGTGASVDDPDARLGKAWLATAASGTPGAYMVYGPYASAKTMWPGAQCTVRYRLKVSDNTTSSNVATIDASSNGGGVVHASRTLTGTDFASADAYQEFTISFSTPSPSPDNWEFRVKFEGGADVYADVIKVVLQPPSSYVTGPISDSSDSTLWSSAEHDSPEAVEDCAVYLGAASVQVRSLAVVAGTASPAGMPVDFDLQYSDDGASWARIPGQSYAGYEVRPGSNSFDFSPVSCRYLRLHATKLGQDTDGGYRLLLAGIDVTPKTGTSVPALVWTYPGAASSYTVLLSPVAHFPQEQTIKIEGVTGTSYTPTVPLAQGTWYWTAKAVNAVGHEGKYLSTVKFEVGDLPESELDPAAALRCEQICDWRNVGNRDTGGDGYSFAFLDDSIASEGSHSLRVVITVNSLNKTTGLINAGTSDVPFAYAGRGLDYSGIDNFTFDVYPKRFCDTTSTVVPSSKYLRFRMTDLSGNIAADQAVDPAGTLPIGQWSTIALPLTGRRCQITRIEFYVSSGADKLTWDERVFFNVDNLTQAPLADMTPPSTPVVSTSGYTVNNVVWAVVESEDPETAVVEYLYAVGSAPGLDDIVAWKSNGSSPNVTESGLSLSDGDVCYISARTINGIQVPSELGTSIPIRKVSLVSSPGEAKTQPEGTWVALQDQAVTACFPGRFYVEQADRSCAIGVVSEDGVSVGDRVTVYGYSQVDGHEALIVGHASEMQAGSALTPVAMKNLSTAGGGVGLQEAAVDDAASGRLSVGLGNVGSLVTAFGSAVYVDPGGDFFYMDDGSGLADGSGSAGIRVDVWGLLAPVQDTYACVTGIMGVTDVDGRCVRLLRPRSAADLVYEQTANYLANGGFETGDFLRWNTIGSPGEVRTGTYYFAITPQSGDCFFASYGYFATNSGTLYQVCPVKPGQNYVASVWSRLLHGGNTEEAAKSRTGLDPTGGVDPASANVVWSDWDSQPRTYFSEWRLLSTPAVAVSAGRVTVFLEYLQQEQIGWHINCLDAARLAVVE